MFGLLPNAGQPRPSLQLLPLDWLLDTRSKAFESQVNKKKLSPSTVRRNARRRAEYLAKKQQIPPSQISNGEAEQTSTVFPCDQCDYLGASEKGLKQHARMKHKKAEATPAPPEALRSSEESSRSLVGSPLPLYNKEENCRNSDGPFSPGHQCGDEEKGGEDDGSDSEEEESDEDSEPPGDFDPPPVLALLQTLSSLTDDDQKRAVLALQLQLNSIIDNK